MEIIDVLEPIMEDKSIRAIVLKGAGRAFCSGDDLENMGQFPPLDEKFKLPHHKLIYLIREVRKPVIALLHGY